MADLIGGLLGNPTAMMGLGLLAGNRGINRRSAFSNALGGGVGALGQAAAWQDAQQRMQLMQAKAQQAQAQQQADEQLAQQMGIPVGLMTEGARTEMVKRMMPAQAPEEVSWWMSATPEEKAAWEDKIRREGRLNPRGSSVSVQNVMPPNIVAGYEYAQGPQGTWSAAPVPGGPHDPYAPKPPTEGQRKTAGFLERMDAVNPEIEELESDVSLKDYFLANTAVTNPLVSDKYQKYLQKSREWIGGALRYESGAAVPETEFWRYYYTYFRVPGDSDEVAAEKRKARLRMQGSLRKSAGPVVAPPGDTQNRLREQGYVD